MDLNHNNIFIEIRFEDDISRKTNDNKIVIFSIFLLPYKINPNFKKSCELLIQRSPSNRERKREEKTTIQTSTGRF